MTRTMTRIALPVAALAALGGLLAGCSDPGGTGPSPTPSTSAAAVDDAALGSALTKLVFQGTGLESSDGGACLVEAVDSQDLSDEAKAYIVERDADDIGAVAEGLSEISSMDAAILLSPELTVAFDACVDAEVPAAQASDGGGAEPTYSVPEPAPSDGGGEQPNLEPTVEVQGGMVTSSAQLEEGLVTMLSSYALDDGQREVFAGAGSCMADVVFDAGFSQEALVFFAGGPAIGTGTVAEHLPTEEDRAIWESPDFNQLMIDCTTSSTTITELDSEG